MDFKHHFAALSDAAAKRVIKQFATKYHLVYLGSVNALLRDDEHQIVRGITASAEHADSHYTVGSLQGYDLILLQRRTTLTFPGRPPTSLKWLILQVDLSRGGLPHAFIDMRQQGETFYARLFSGLPGIADLTQEVTQAQPVLAKRCKVFAFPYQHTAVQGMLPPQLLHTLTGQLAEFDVEIADDRLYVYYAANRVTTPALHDLLRAGLWLASTLSQPTS